MMAHIHKLSTVSLGFRKHGCQWSRLFRSLLRGFWHKISYGILHKLLVDGAIHHHTFGGFQVFIWDFEFHKELLRWSGAL